MPPWSTQSAAEFPLSTLADLFTAGFAGYLIPLVMTSDALAERLAAEDIHLASSRVLLLDAQPAGLALIARRGRESRLAAMAIVQPARHRGAGRALLAPLLEDARVRGDRRMRLEVFESNLPARALYEGAGFRRTARLVGYDLPSPPAIAAGLREVDATEFARQLARCDAGPLPWQLEPASLSAPPAAARCFSLEERAFAYISGIPEKSIAVRGLLTLEGHRRNGWARRLLAGLAAQFPGRAISVPPLVPEGLGAAFFTALGFQQSALTQLEMALPLC